MSQVKAWVMIVSRDADPYNFVRRELKNFPSMVVLGPYDIVVRVTSKTLEELYGDIKKIGISLGTASATTYLCMKRGEKDPGKSNVCILIDTASQDTESCWKLILTFR